MTYNVFSGMLNPTNRPNLILTIIVIVGAQVITAAAPHQSTFTGRMLFLTPNQQRRSIKNMVNEHRHASRPRFVQKTYTDSLTRQLSRGSMLK